MLNKNLKLLLLTVSTIFSLSLHAQGPGGGPGGQGQMRGGQNGPQQNRERPTASQIIEHLDTNNDNKISKDEASRAERGRLAQDFDLIDTNKDGFIVLAELKLFMESRRPKKMSPKKLIKTTDKNGDGLLSKDELDAKKHRHMIQNFSTIDTNKDGKLNAEELKAFLAKNKPQRPNNTPRH